MKRILTISFLAVLAWGQAIAQYSKVLKDFENAAPKATVNVTVQFKPAPGDKRHSIVTGEGEACKAAACRASAIWGTLAAWRPSTSSDSGKTSGANFVAPMTGIATPESISIAINGEN